VVKSEILVVQFGKPAKVTEDGRDFSSIG